MFGQQEVSNNGGNQFLKHFFNCIKFTGETDFYTSSKGSLDFKVEVENKDGVKGTISLNSYFINPTNTKSTRYMAETISLLALSLGGEDFQTKVNAYLGKCYVASEDVYEYKLKEQTVEFISDMIKEVIKQFAKIGKYCWVAIKGKEGNKPGVIYTAGLISFSQKFSENSDEKVNMAWTCSESAFKSSVTDESIGVITSVTYTNKSGEETTINAQPNNDYWLEKAEQMDSNQTNDPLSTDAEETFDNVEDLPFD